MYAAPVTPSAEARNLPRPSSRKPRKTRRIEFTRPVSLLLVLALALGTFWTLPVSPVQAVGTTYYVSTTGADTNAGTQASPFRTIQKAVNTAAPGDSVVVNAGTYAERVTLSKTASSTLPIRIRSASGSGSTTVSKGFSITGSYYEVTGFTVTPMDPALGSIGAFSIAGNRNTVRDARVRDTVIGHGFDFTGTASYNTIEDFSAIRVYLVGVGFGPNSVGNTIRGGEIRWWGGDVAVGSMKGTRNTVEGIDIQGPSRNVTGSTPNGDAIIVDGVGHTIRNNRIYDMFRPNVAAHTDGIQWWTGVSDLMIEGNIFGTQSTAGSFGSKRDPDNSAIMLGVQEPSDNVTIRNNVFMGSGSMTINVNPLGGFTTTNMKIYNNIFWSSSLDLEAMPGVKVKNNIFNGNKYALVNSPGADADYNLYGLAANKPAAELNSKVGSPVFVKPDFSATSHYGLEADFRLASTSPAINAGIADGFAPTTDKAGAPRVGRPEMGVFEYGSTAPTNPTNPTTPTAPAPDTTAPSVQLTSPLPGAVVTGNVPLAATASDNTAVARVEFFVDGTLVGSDSTAPYSAVWNATGATAGNHTVQAKAFDSAGLTATSSAIVSVATASTPTTTTPSPSGNIAAASVGGKVASFSKEFDSRGYAAYVIDGKSAFNATYTGWWVQNPTAAEHVTVELPNESDVDAVNVVNDGQYGSRSVVVKGSRDGVTWSTLGTFTGLGVTTSTVVPNVLKLATPARVKQLRFEFPQPNNTGWLQINELEAYGKAATTAPADTTAPVSRATVTPAVPNGAAAWYTVVPNVALSADETSTIRYQWDTTSTAGWSTYAAPLAAPQGAHTLYYFATDSAGNAESVKSQAVKTDNVAPLAPRVSGLSQATGQWSSARQVAARYDASDSGSGMSGFSHAWDQSAQSAADSVRDIAGPSALTTSPVLTDGTWYLHLRALDVAGNAGDTTHVGPFLVDGTAPSVPVVSSLTHADANLAYADASPAFSWASVDALAGVEGASYVIDRLPDTTPDLVSEGKVSSASFNGLSDGVWYLHVRTLDAAGNWSETAHRRVEIDTTGPVASSLTASATGTAVSLAWNAAADAAETRIFRSTTGYAASPTDAAQTKVYEGAASSFTDTVPTSGVTYYYTAFTRDALGNWGTAATATVGVSAVTPTTLSMYASRTSLRLGRSVTLWTTLTARGASLGGRSDVYLERSADGVNWTTDSAAVWNASYGRYDVRRYPSAPTYYRFRFGGDGTYGASVSQPILVRVYR